MSKDHLTNLLNDRYGNLRITKLPRSAPSSNNVETSLYADVDTRNPRLLYFSLSLESLYTVFHKNKKMYQNP